MKVLMVAHHYPPHVGGLEIVAIKQAQALRDHGHSVRVVTFAPDGTAPGVTTENDIQVFRKRGSNILERNAGIPFPFPGFGMIACLWRQARWADAVHIHDVFYISSWLGYLFARLHGKPVILVQHVAMVVHPRMVVMFAQRIVYGTWGRLMFGGAHSIIVYNKTVFGFLQARGVHMQKVIEMRNGIEIDLFSPASAQQKSAVRRTFSLPEDRKLVLFVGRLVPKKGFDVLFEARSQEYDIVFVGPGSVPDAWRDQENVHFLGPVDRAQLPDLYRAVDLFVFPARGELFTLVMQEAMAAGLPVVTTDEPEYRLYELDRERVCLCEPSAAMLREHIARILSDESLRSRMGAYALEYARTHFDWEQNTQPLLDLYAALPVSEGRDASVSRKTRVMLIAPYFYPKIGGVENYVYNLALRFEQSGKYVVRIVTTNRERNEYEKEDIGNNIVVYRLPVWLKVSNTPINFRWYFMLRNIFKDEQPDIINAHTPVPFLADMASFAAWNIPFVLTYHAGTMKKGTWRTDLVIAVYEKIFLRMLFRNVSMIAAVSKHFFSGPWGAAYRHKTVLIRPGVDTRVFAPTPTGDQEIVTYVGRVEHNSSWKGIKQLLHAMALVLRTHPHARLEIVGGGDAVDFYAQEAEALGIRQSVDFLGSKRDKELIDAYRRSSVVVLPSISNAEQSSVTLIEAMASGRPVIGTNIGGTPDIIQDGENGLLVPPNDIPRLAGAIIAILENKSLASKLSSGGIQSAREVDWNVQAEKYLTLFESILSKNGESTPV